MKKLIILSAFALLALPRPARAQTQMFQTVSSATWCAISISTVAPTRADNFNGACEGLMNGRTSIRIIKPTAPLYGGFDATLSTITTSAKYGEAIATTSVLELPLSSAMEYYLMGEPAATEPKVLIQQFRPKR